MPSARPQNQVLPKSLLSCGGEGFSCPGYEDACSPESQFPMGNDADSLHLPCGQPGGTFCVFSQASGLRFGEQPDRNQAGPGGFAAIPRGKGRIALTGFSVRAGSRTALYGSAQARRSIRRLKREFSVFSSAGQFLFPQIGCSRLRKAGTILKIHPGIVWNPYTFCPFCGQIRCVSALKDLVRGDRMVPV